MGVPLAPRSWWRSPAPWRREARVATPIFVATPETAATIYHRYNKRVTNNLHRNNDIQPLGNGSTPRMYYGLNLGANYKGFDLTVFLQGAAGHNIYISGDVLDPFIQQGLGNGLAIMTDRWHREDPTDPYSNWIPGMMPAARPTGLADNRSDNPWSLHKADYLRLKTLEIGYTMPRIVALGVSKIRMYANCNNLLTFTKRDGLMEYVDPESDQSRLRYYPQMKTFNFGINVTF